MPAPVGSDDIDLSGAWAGLYSFPTDGNPVFFDTIILEADAWLSGTITEAIVDGGRRRNLQSVLQGRRLGRSVTWLKIYDGSLAAYDTVHYEGAISGDATEIEGKWNIPGNWSGTFLMIRSGGKQAVRSRSAIERV